MVHILDETQIQENYEKFRKLINQTFTGDRLESLNKMYDHIEDRIVLTPASSTEHFHQIFIPLLSVYCEGFLFPFFDGCHSAANFGFSVDKQFEGTTF